MNINFKLILKIVLIFFASIIGITLISIIIGYFYLNNIVKKTGKDIPYFINTTKAVYQNNPYQNSKNINILVLGLDKRDDSLEKTQTTDTIIFASVNTKSGDVNLISLPRDLWDYELKMKINGIYPLSLEKENSFSFLQSEFEKIVGQKIDKTIVITTDNLIDMIKTINGVDVVLENGFIDDQYPNPDYVANPKSGAPIYKTIQFPAGLNHLDESNITEFVRSRKSAETAAQGGTDIGRIVRQQLLIEAIMSKIKSPQFLSNYHNLINLYNFWQKEISTNISDSDLIAIGLKIGNNAKNIKLNKINIPIGNNLKEGIIYHPETTRFTKQWIYIPIGENNYSKLHEFIFSSLN